MAAAEQDYIERLYQNESRMIEAVAPSGVLDTRVAYILWVAVAIFVCAFSQQNAFGFGPFPPSVSKPSALLFLLVALLYWYFELICTWVLASKRVEVAVNEINYGLQTEHEKLVDEAIAFEAKIASVTKKADEIWKEHNKKLKTLLERQSNLPPLLAFGSKESDQIDKEIEALEGWLERRREEEGIQSLEQEQDEMILKLKRSRRTAHSNEFIHQYKNYLVLYRLRRWLQVLIPTLFLLVPLSVGMRALYLGMIA